MKTTRRAVTIPSGSMGVAIALSKQLVREGKRSAVEHFLVDPRPTTESTPGGTPPNNTEEDVPFPDPRLLGTEMVIDPQTGVPCVSLIRQHFIKEGRLTCDAASDLINRARQVFSAEPTLLELLPPLNLCGDTHGQFYDVLSLFEIGGACSNSDSSPYLFLGDYVDRGCFSCEIVLYLCALKLAFPNKLFLIRGNHESRLMCEFMTFRTEVLHKYSPSVYEDFHRLFDSLPLAAVIRQSPVGDCFCVHGGIGPAVQTLDDIRSINRFMEPPKSTGFWDLLWSDPLSDWGSDGLEEYYTTVSSAGGSNDQFEGISSPMYSTTGPATVGSRMFTRQEWEQVTFIPNTFRHSSVLYGLRAVKNFLHNNQLAAIIRGHQVQLTGYCEHWANEPVEEQPTTLAAASGVPQLMIAPCLTIFSAPNYSEAYGNTGALLQILEGRFVVKQFSDVPHPFYLPGFIDGLSWSLPILLDNIVSSLRFLIMSIIEEGSMIRGGVGGSGAAAAAAAVNGMSEEERLADLEFERKVRMIYSISRRLRVQQQDMRKVLDPEYHPNMIKFLQMLAHDNLEACPPSSRYHSSSSSSSSLHRCLSTGSLPLASPQ